MIISKTPLRISFCGGGSDIASFYRKHGGCVLSTSIDKFIYISTVRSFNQDVTLLKYSVVEETRDISDIRHPVFRAMLGEFGMGGYECNSCSLCIRRSRNQPYTFAIQHKPYRDAPYF